MNLTEVQKQELLTKHLPVLLVNTDDIGTPVDPVQFVKMSALWRGQRPGLDNKSLWGSAAGAGRRSPLVARGGLDLASFGSLGHEFAADELWLDCGGWSGGQDVDTGIDNRQPNVARLATLFRSDRMPVVSTEVCDGDVWSTMNSNMVERALGLSGLELSQLLSNTVLINYQMLFAAHTQDAVEAFRDGTEYAASDFEGDWVCFSLLLSAPSGNGDTETNPTELRPRFALFERRFRNQSASFGENLEVRRFESVSWDEMPKFDSHPFVLVAHGTHNLYPVDTATTPSGHVKIQNVSAGYGSTVTDDINAFGRKWIKNTPASAAVLGVIIAKMAVGAAIIPPFGGIVGLVAGIAEASPIAKALFKDPGPLEINPETETIPDSKPIKDPSDKFKTYAQGTQAYVVVADETIDIQKLTEYLTFDASIDEVLLWSGRSREPVDRQLERYWPTYDGFNSQGYLGRWGVRCENDMFNRRAGGILPDYRIEVLRNVISLLV